MGKKKEYKEANRRFLKKTIFSGRCFQRCRVESITKFWKLAKVRFLRVHGALLPCITKEV